MISLNGGSLAEQKLDRYLARTNADQYTPIDRTEKFLQRLCREGYLVKTREMDAGEEVVEYMVGPRGKIEVGSGGVAGLVREVYGHGEDGSDAQPTQGEREIRQEFEMRLRRSLGIVDVRDNATEGDEEPQSQVNGHQEEQRSRRSRSSRRAAADASSGDESEASD